MEDHWFFRRGRRRTPDDSQGRDPPLDPLLCHRSLIAGFGDRFFSARSAYVEHLMAVTRWPGARPSHAAVTSRLIGIVHRARVYACLLKTSLGTHVSLCVSVYVSVGGSRTEQTHVYRSEPLSSQSANLRCYSGVCMLIANPYRHSQTSGRIVFVLEVLT